jgi:hypothetical protein
MNRRAVEALMDEMLAQSFPANDPSTWDTAADRVERIASAGTQEATSKGDEMPITVPAWPKLSAVGLGMMLWVADMIGARGGPPATPPDARRVRRASM